MKYKILIDATPLTNVVDGLSNYITGIITNLPEDSFDRFEFTILINPGLKRDDFIPYLKKGNFRILETKIKPIGPLRDWDMFWFLKKHKADYDLIHITSNNYPLSLKNGVCTIHDITFRSYFDEPRFSFKLATKYMSMVISNCLKKAQAVIAVSHSTKNELIKWYRPTKQQQDKITVVHEGYEHLNNPADQNERCQMQPGFDSNYLFYLGTLRIHKNISGLLEAFRLALDHIPPHVKLIISGHTKFLKSLDRRTIEAINKNGTRVLFPGYLSNACVEQYFENADAYIFPSLSEGFGIPILEAFYYKKPVLCSDTTSMPEVAGDAAIYFNPFDPQSIANAIIDFYKHPGIIPQMIEKGNAQLQKFSWKKAAEETISVYDKCLNALQAQTKADAPL